MANITIKMKDGTIRNFPPQNRSGGSWSNSVRYKEGFAVVTDEYGKETAFPAGDISEVISEPNYRGF